MTNSLMLLPLAICAGALYGCMRYVKFARVIPLCLLAITGFATLGVPPLGAALTAATSGAIGMAALLFADAAWVFVVYHEVISAEHYHPRRTNVLAAVGGFASATTWLNWHVIAGALKMLPGVLWGLLTHSTTQAPNLPPAHLTPSDQTWLYVAAGIVAYVWFMTGRRMKKLLGTTKQDRPRVRTLSPTPMSQTKIGRSAKQAIGDGGGAPARGPGRNSRRGVPAGIAGPGEGF